MEENIKHDNKKNIRKIAYKWVSNNITKISNQFTSKSEGVGIKKDSNSLIFLYTEGRKYEIRFDDSDVIEKVLEVLEYE